MYLVSTVFKDTEMAFICYVCINLFISMNTIISTAIVYFLGQTKHNMEVRNKPEVCQSAAPSFKATFCAEFRLFVQYEVRTELRSNVRNGNVSL